VISTDHCPFCMSEGHLGKVNQKALGRNDFSRIPNGVPGVETRLTVVYDGGVRQHRLSLNRFVEVTATAPAKIFGMFPRKGTIAVGSDADLVIFDPDERHVLSAATHHSNCDYTLFEGREVQGRVQKVFLRGELIVEGNRWLGRTGGGAFVKRGATVGS
jgi:dihydropyrimidinase